MKLEGSRSGASSALMSVRARTGRLPDGVIVIPVLSLSKLRYLLVTLLSIAFVAVCVGVLVIFLSMYTTITERTREIGILRSMGASKQFIVALIFQETAVVCVLGIFIGIFASLIIAHGVTSIFPTLLVLITGDWIAKSSVLALFSGVIGSLYPSLKAAAQDPVDALAYE